MRFSDVHTCSHYEQMCTSERKYLWNEALPHPLCNMGQAADSETDVLLVYVANKLMLILFTICVS